MSENWTKLVVLICEEALENIVVPELLAAGAKGYTVCDARGRGNRGVRDARWLLSSNVRIEMLCNEPVASHILDMVETKYCANYGLVIYMVDAKVNRGGKF